MLLSLFREYVNLTNIKTFLKVKESAEKSELFKRYFVPGGDYTIDFFMHHMEEELGLFIAQLAKTRHERDIVSQGLRTWPDDKSFWRLELECDNFVLQRFWRMRMQLFSIAPIIHYLLRKEAEVKLVRAILRCKHAGMSRPQTEERLRYIYV